MKRINIIRYCWFNPSENELLKQPNRLGKYNLKCGCRSCKMDKVWRKKSKTIKQKRLDLKT